MSAQPAPATGQQPEERMRGYFEVGFASLANGSIGVTVTYADMPATMLLCLRMAFAAAVRLPRGRAARAWPTAPSA